MYEMIADPALVNVVRELREIDLGSFTVNEVQLAATDKLLSVQNHKAFSLRSFN